MTSHLLKNGEVLCDLIPSFKHPMPTVREHCWHDCSVLATNRVEARPSDIFSIVVAERESMPFRVSRCRVAVDGWQVEGKVLF